jgi:hypothetical protein
VARRWLQAIPRLCGDGFRYGIGIGRERTELGMVLWDIVDAPTNSSDLAGLGQAAQSLRVRDMKVGLCCFLFFVVHYLAYMVR